MGGFTCQMFHFMADMINMLYSFTGLIILILGLLLIFYPWGEADPGFFYSAGICLTLFSFVILSISWLGSMAYRYKEVATGKMTGKRILGIYFTFLIGLLCSEVFFVDFGMKLIAELTWTSGRFKNLKPGQVAAPAFFESYLLQSFNAFFFGAVRAVGCRDEQFMFLWKFLEYYCPQIQYKYCQACYPDRPTQCLAYKPLCYADEYNNGQGPGLGPQCPYAICRGQILDFVNDKSKIFVYCLLGLLILHLLLMVLVVILFCFAKNANAIRRRSLMKVAPDPTVTKQISINERKFAH